jgi:predicted Zn-dependent protease with MMP-like domain
MTRREILVVACGLTGVLVALVALLLGHEVVAVIAVLVVLAVCMPSAFMGGTPWGEGGRWSMSESDFEDLVNQSEKQSPPSAATPEGNVAPRDPHDPTDFQALISEALDELPDFMQAELARNVAVVISDDGSERGAYGLYWGDTAARDDVSDRILIYRDTLLQDFGDDPDELRRQVTITVRHELAHHLGASENHVSDLGL